MNHNEILERIQRKKAHAVVKRDTEESQIARKVWNHLIKDLVQTEGIILAIVEENHADQEAY